MDSSIPTAEAQLRPLDVSGQLDGARLLVLGGTGFLGKIFWGMLLDRYPSVGKIYLLIRRTGPLSAEDRFWQISAKSEALRPLRVRHPGEKFGEFLRAKVVPLEGDVALPSCGLSSSIVAELRGTLDAVVNIAGVVDFNPPLDEALNANAIGVQNLVALSRSLGDVPILHTSTCYVAGRRKGPILESHPLDCPFPRSEKRGIDGWDAEGEIDECLDVIRQAHTRTKDSYQQSALIERAKAALQSRGEPADGTTLGAEVAKLERKRVREELVKEGVARATHWGWPNIYTYTKSLGEQVVARSGLPFTIARPACCETTVEYPFEGWNEGISTSAPIIFMAMSGQVQIPSRHVALDFIPTDMVCAGMVMSLAELLEGTHKPVYQYGASDVNPCTSSRFGELIGLYKRKHYQNKGKGNPFVNLLQSHIEPVFISPERFQSIGSPAIATAARDAASLIKKVIPTNAWVESATTTLESFSAREEKIAAIMNLFVPFTTEENGPFSCENTRAAYARLGEADRAKLRWAPEEMDWADWMHRVHMPAMVKWILPEMEKKLERKLSPLRPFSTVGALVKAMAERHAEATALQRFSGESFEKISYREVYDRASVLSEHLLTLGIRKGERVILAGTNDPSWVISYFGIVQGGRVAVPVDPGLEPEQLAKVVADSDAKAAVWDGSVETNSGAHVRAVHRTLKVLRLEDAGEGTFVSDESRLNQDENARAPHVQPSDIASIIYTSGTTGTPKGVILTHANFMSLIASLAPVFPLRSGDRALSVLPLHHTFEFTCGLLLPFSRGARITYLDELTGDRLAAALKHGKITAMVGVPALWQLLERRILAKVTAQGKVANAAFTAAGGLNRFLGSKLGIDIGRVLFHPIHEEMGGHIRYLISGGAALPRETHQLFASMGLPLAEGYGLTEAAPVLAVSKPKPGAKSGEVGKPIPGVSIRIDHPDDAGVGEVMARGPNVMAGYTDQAATLRAFDSDGWLRTGDLGKLGRDGHLTIVGRLKEIIVTATGENIYPDEVERRLGTIEGISELAIVGIEAKTGGERIACLAVPERDDDVERAVRIDVAMKRLRAAIVKLPYSQQPAVIHLYDAPLPRSVSRKVKREEVKAVLHRMIAATNHHIAKSVGWSDVKASIAAMKGMEPNELSHEATLHGDLGFDSLMLTELLEVLERTGRTVDPLSLSACRTIRDVEILVKSPQAADLKPRASQVEEGERFTLPSPLQEGGKHVIGKLQDAFYGRVMKPRVFGRAFIPHNRNTIVIANHTSHLDMGFVRHALGPYGSDIVSLAAQDYFFEGGVRRAFFENLTNLKAIDRTKNLRQALRDASEVIAQGKTVLIFPEGTRSEGGDIQAFKPLIGHLALTHGVDILPIHLGGTHASLPKGAIVPVNRAITARIGRPLEIHQLRRLTEGMSSSDAAREVTRLARLSVIALRDGGLFDLADTHGEKPEASPHEHPLVAVFAELESRFRPEKVERPVSFYFTLGGDTFAKWTVKVAASGCEIIPGKPDGFSADCVLKTSTEIFTKIVRESYVPGAAEFLSGAIKSNDVALLQTFQRVFQL